MASGPKKVVESLRSFSPPSQIGVDYIYSFTQNPKIEQLLFNKWAPKWGPCPPKSVHKSQIFTTFSNYSKYL